MAEADPTLLHLEVYETKSGLWHPEHGDLDKPPGWELLPSGDAFMTRQVKAAGSYWIVFRPKGRNRHRRQLGLLAPSESVRAAHEAAARTSSRRATQRQAGSRQRKRAESAYRADFEAAVLQWLAFRSEHRVIAEEIAAGAVSHATEVGSGRVGRTRQISLEDRAALAARAYIRHRYTGYEDALFELELDELGVDADTDLDAPGNYRDIKRTAQREVDAFLDRHRGT